ncbi:MAG: YfhO family protein [Prevotellaceae bacterium]|jgi:hypothetical protein|nr:YfhO family protein [Prevotellaceae bacterium]
MKTKFKQFLPHITAIAVFLVVSVGYFTPAVFERKALFQYDIRSGAGMGNDLNEHMNVTGEKSLWASRMFSGMPSYQIVPGSKTAPVLRKIRDVFEGWCLPAPANYLFAFMLGFFILLLALRVNPWIAIIGAIAYAFSSYFLIIIEAGHIWKVCVLELVPPALAGIIWAYRGKFLTGGIVTALFFALQLFSNHIQMTYYFLLFVGIFVICRFVYDIRKRQLAKFFKATLVLIVAGLIGFGTNSTNMILSAKHSEQTIRGKSELTDNDGNKTGGLDRDYATQWSYGIGETFTLLIPNTKGGASGRMDQNHRTEVRKSSLKNNDQTKNLVAQQNSYWGNQPFTSGPVYAGAFIVFLFVFGLFVVKGYLKWALLAGTVFSILLAWGHNFMWFTDLFLDYFPMYSKFRAVASILVVAELTIPVLAILSLCKLIENRRLMIEKRREFLISLGLTAGVALLFILLPQLFFDFFSKQEQQAFEQNMRNPSSIQLFDALGSVRIAIFRSDAWRSIIIILIGAGLLWLYSAKTMNKSLLIAAIAILTLFDLANVDKRYLNNNDFVLKRETKTAWQSTDADRQILKDPDPNFRVFNLSLSAFNDASTSYYHKSIGGYHGAKLRRYQDIIDKYLSSVNMSVLNMLNTKYMIFSDPNNSGKLRIQLNPDALGNAWYVDTVRIVDNPNEEIAAIGEVNLKNTAVVDKRFENQLENFVYQQDNTRTIEMTDYKINDIKYKSNSNTEQIAVFSEIYYNDGLTAWDAFIDGQPVPHFRANYVLRALRIPAGEHTIEFVFKPKAVDTLETVSMLCLWIFAGCIFIAIILRIIGRPVKSR